MDLEWICNFDYSSIITKRWAGPGRAGRGGAGRGWAGLGRDPSEYLTVALLRAAVLRQDPSEYLTVALLRAAVLR